MSGTEEEIINFLTQRAKAFWEDPETPKPYLLSFAGPDLREAQIDYQNVLAGERVKAFVERTQGQGKYHVVKHPTQPARIGLVPWGVEYQFEKDDSSASPDQERTKLGMGRGSLLIEFLHALETLPDSDVDEIHIPTRALIKLARKK